MRFLVVASVLVGVVVAAGLASVPRSAWACSVAPMQARYMPDFVERTEVIAIGTWAESEARRVTLVVDEGLKGAAKGDEFVVDNRLVDLGADCSTYEQPFRRGHRFKDGQRWIVFLEKEVDGLWHVGWLSYAAFDVPADDLEPLSWQEDGGDLFSDDLLSDVKGAVATSDTATADAAMETELGCQPPYIFDVRRVAEYTSLATSVALVTVEESPEWREEGPNVAITVTVDEVLAGRQPAPIITLNDYWISDYFTLDCEPALEAGRRLLLEGQQYLVFLRADEFGVAEYRPVAWGKAIVSVNERWLTHDQPTLGQIRELTARYRPPPSATEPTEVPAASAGETNTPPTESDSTDADAGSNTGEGDGVSVIPIIAGLATAAFAVGVVVVARRRWLQRG